MVMTIYISHFIFYIFQTISDGGDKVSAKLVSKRTKVGRKVVTTGLMIRKCVFFDTTTCVSLAVA